MKSEEQFKEIYHTLFLGGGNMPDDLKELLKSQIGNLQVTVQRELIEAEQKGMTDAYAAMSATVDAKCEYYSKQLTDDEKQAYYHEEEKTKQIILNHLK
jgi:hypothetical protein